MQQTFALSIFGEGIIEFPKNETYLKIFSYLLYSKDSQIQLHTILTLLLMSNICHACRYCLISKA